MRHAAMGLPLAHDAAASVVSPLAADLAVVGGGEATDGVVLERIGGLVRVGALDDATAGIAREGRLPGGPSMTAKWPARSTV